MNLPEVSCCFVRCIEATTLGSTTAPPVYIGADGAMRHPNMKSIHNALLSILITIKAQCNVRLDIRINKCLCMSVRGKRQVHHIYVCIRLISHRNLCWLEVHSKNSRISDAFIITPLFGPELITFNVLRGVTCMLKITQVSLCLYGRSIIHILCCVYGRGIPLEKIFYHQLQTCAV